MTDPFQEEPALDVEPEGRRLLGFRSHLRVESVTGDATYLISDRGVTALEGSGIEALAPLLDGTRDLTAVLHQTASVLPAEQTGRLIGRLAREGLVGYRRTRTADPAQAYWDLAGLDAGEALERLASARVELTALGGVPADEVESAFRANGVTPVPGDAGAELAVVLCDDYLDPELREFDARRRAQGRPWLLARPSGASVWVGPVFQPGAGPCWSCLAHRLRGQRASEIPVQRALGLRGPVPRPATHLRSGCAAGAQLVVLEAVKWLAGYRHQGQCAVMALDTLTLESRHHPLHRRPQCAECGDPGLTAAQLRRPVQLGSRAKGSRVGGHRACSAKETLDRFGHLVSPVTGVVSSIQRDPHAPPFFDCYVSGRNHAVGGANLRQLRAGLRQVSGGKGTTPLDAEVGALCEALERYSGTLQGDELRIRDSLRGLGDEAVHPDTCQLFDPRQYRDRDRWNASHNALQFVPEPFDENAAVDWTPVWSLTEKRQRLLPTGMLYFNQSDSTIEPVAGRRSLRACSNGNAAGSCLEDAVLQGFLELVERDAVALWWYNRTRQPAVSLDAFADPWTDDLLVGYQRLHRHVWALDLTSDLGIPVFVALSRRTDKAAQDIMFGFGAHLDPRIALRRALTEMNQLLPAAVDALPGGGGYHVDEPEVLDWWQRATVHNQPYLVPACSAARRPEDFAYHGRSDFNEDLADITRLLDERGMELLLLDQTRPDIGLPVVKVIVPGLRHFWARFAPGRLFDVPVRLGRVPEPTAYAELNPVPLFV
ncbi:TOMM precursor leader peptide-binding protein [Streptacidiphilus sp. PB12-B1b]|uniref:TOMM precursor leader peptide-binding protein n=1 Tax=Streptacidiphilus sp. PB12-B1b TaxID=2705012 RepID=UPI0015F97DBD|nr:TOMM precursor leader peptide-binding protein [Streptacidiphilus sp. PB12-B1b]QMU78125.1 TOMM precursor leader peptide-binding protein [Streptacidiphilus sp. PB12-B1b]